MGVTTEVLATNPAIQERALGSEMAVLVFSNKNINDVIKVVKSLEESGLLVKGVREGIKTEAQKVRFLVCYYA